MGFFIPVLFFLAANATFVLLSGKNFGKCMPITMMACCLILFASGMMFNDFAPGLLACCLAALIFPLTLVGQMLTRILQKTPPISHSRLKSFASNYFTFGFFLFVTLYCMVYVLDLYRSFTVWDEFSHWGIMVKEMLRLNTFYSDPTSSLSIHKDYPPALCLFQYLYCRLSGGSYEEAYLYRAVHLFTFSLFLLPLAEGKAFARITKGNVLCLVALPVLALLICNTDPVGFYFASVYSDVFLGILIAFCLFVALRENLCEPFYLVALGASLSTLLLTKQMGIAFYVLTFAAVSLRYACIASAREEAARFFHRKRLVVAAIILLFAIPLALSASWSGYVNSLHLSQQFTLSSIRLDQLLGIAQGAYGKPWQHEAMVQYLYAMLFNALIARPIVLSYPQFIAGVILIFSILCAIISRGEKEARRNIAVANAVIVMGAVGYAFALMLLYVFAFNEYEGSNLASIERYLGTYTLAATALAVFVVLRALAQRFDANRIALPCMCAALCLFVFWAPDILRRAQPVLSETAPSSIEAEALFIASKTESDDRIYFISQADNGFNTYHLAYYLSPRATNTNINFRFGDPGSSVYNTNASLAELQGMIESYDYLYLDTVDEYFTDRYSSLFENPEEIGQKRLYEIENGDEVRVRFTAELPTA